MPSWVAWLRRPRGLIKREEGSASASLISLIRVDNVL